MENKKLKALKIFAIISLIELLIMIGLLIFIFKNNSFATMILFFTHIGIELLLAIIFIIIIAIEGKKEQVE